MFLDVFLCGSLVESRGPKAVPEESCPSKLLLVLSRLGDLFASKDWFELSALETCRPCQPQVLVWIVKSKAIIFPIL